MYTCMYTCVHTRHTHLWLPVTLPACSTGWQRHWEPQGVTECCPHTCRCVAHTATGVVNGRQDRCRLLPFSRIALTTSGRAAAMSALLICFSKALEWCEYIEVSRICLPQM